MGQATATAAVVGTDNAVEMGELCAALLRDAEADRRRVAKMEKRLDQLVRVVRFGLGALLEGFEDPASEEVLDLAEPLVAA